MNTSIAESIQDKTALWLYKMEDGIAAKRSKSIIQKHEERHRSQTPSVS
jgi:hypothetical protein